MNRWIARLLALALAAAAVYLVYVNVHAPALLLECTLGAAILAVATVFLVWKRPVAALILNIVWLGGAFAAAWWLGHGLPNFTATREALAPAAAPAEGSPQPVSSQLDDVAKALVPQDYEIAALAKSLPDVDSAFGFVRDKIRFESYSGILRGGQGTLDARAGNALDRAMLLAAILQSNKVSVRIVTGQLPEAQAQQLFDRIFETGAASSPQAIVSPQAAALKDRVFARGRRDYNVVVSALGGVPAAPLPSRDDVVKEIEQHAWVQAQRKGQWVDLDPSFPDSSVGKTYATVAQSYDTPPAPLMQKVTIRVIAETLDSGALKKDVVLESASPAYQLLDSEVLLTHQVYRPFSGQGGDLQFVFGNKDTMQPILSIDGNIVEGKPINYGAGASPAGAATPNAVQAAANAFGTPASHAPDGPVFVAEWLEFQVDFPDGRSETTRRVLIDRGGTAWRRAASPDVSKLTDLGRNKEGLIAPQTLYNIWLSGGQHDLYAFSNSVRAILDGVGPGSDKAPDSLSGLGWPLAVRDLSWFVASDGAIVPAINDTPGMRFYADSPRIFVWGVGPDPTGKSNQIVIESDLRRDTLRGLAKGPNEAVAVAQHKLLFGALEGALEHEMSAPPYPDASTEFVTTSSLANAGDVVAISSETTAQKAADPETDARIKTALANGDTLVIPKQVLGGGMSGWWQISHNGDMRAVLDDDLDMGFTKGGYGNMKPPPGGTPQKYNPIKGPIGEPKTPYLPQSDEYYRSKPKPKGEEFQEYETTNWSAHLASPVFKFIAASVVAAGTWSYVIFWALDKAMN